MFIEVGVKVRHTETRNEWTKYKFCHDSRLRIA